MSKTRDASPRRTMSRANRIWLWPWINVPSTSKTTMRVGEWIGSDGMVSAISLILNIHAGQHSLSLKKATNSGKQQGQCRKEHRTLHDGEFRQLLADQHMRPPGLRPGRVNQDDRARERAGSKQDGRHRDVFAD